MYNKIEMFNGKSNNLEIMGLDSEGELYVKKIIEGKPDPDYRYFSCSGHNWNNALDLGRKMGWVATGTILEKTLDSLAPQISAYEPSSWGDDDYKIFMAEDATALANALDNAIGVMKDFQLKEYGKPGAIILTPTMSETEYKHINRNLTEGFLDGFVTFLRKGKFIFVWDD